jgi:hypothetical protein
MEEDAPQSWNMMFQNLETNMVRGNSPQPIVLTGRMN